MKMSQFAQSVVSRSAVALALCVGAAAAVSHATPVPLANPSFEIDDAGAPVGVFAGWGNFGPNVLRRAEFANTGTFSCKIFQSFSGVENYSGVSQIFTASAGDQLIGKMWGQHVAGDTLVGANRCVLKFDYLNVDGVVFASSAETLMLNSSSGTGINQYTVTDTAPAGTVQASLSVVFIGEAAFSGGAAFIDDASATRNGSPVTLINPSFENAGVSAPKWQYFNAAGRSNSIPRTGAWGLNTNADPNNLGFSANGAFQNVPVTAGNIYKLSCWAAHTTVFGPVSGTDFAVLNIEWFNSIGGQISFDSVSAIAPLTDLNAYHLIENTAIAPSGAVVGRPVLLYLRFGINAGGNGAAPGVVLWDDVSMEDLSVSGCLADVNLDGVVDGGDFTVFINSFGVGDSTIDPAADVTLDGIVDGNDFVAFINAFGAGC